MEDKRDVVEREDITSLVKNQFIIWNNEDRPTHQYYFRTLGVNKDNKHLSSSDMPLVLK